MRIRLDLIHIVIYTLNITYIIRCVLKLLKTQNTAKVNFMVYRELPIREPEYSAENDPEHPEFSYENYTENTEFSARTVCENTEFSATENSVLANTVHARTSYRRERCKIEKIFCPESIKNTKNN